MTDPVEQFEAALAKCRAAAEHMAAIEDVNEWAIACGQYERTCSDLAEAAAKHGPYLLARLRAENAELRAELARRDMAARTGASGG